MRSDECIFQISKERFNYMIGVPNYKTKHLLQRETPFGTTYFFLGSREEYVEDFLQRCQYM